MIPPNPAATAAAAALRSESRECWTTPGMDGIGTGSRAPSLTNTGSTSCRAATEVSRTSPRIAAEVRNLLGRPLGYISLPSPTAVWMQTAVFRPPITAVCIQTADKSAG